MGGRDLVDAELADGLCSFIRRSPSPFHVVESVRARLARAGFTELFEGQAWRLDRGGSYYTVRNGASIVCFRIGERVDEPAFHLTVAHTDSPTLKLKARPDLVGPGPYRRLDVEPYGGVIDRTWLDRPVTLAGRAFVDAGGILEPRLVHFDRDLLVIPSVAIHLARDVNEKGAIDRAHDLYPLLSASGEGKGGFIRMLAEELGVDVGQVLGFDLGLASRIEPHVWGVAGEFVSAAQLDDLQCAYAALEGFVSSDARGSISMLALLGNEEVGSSTMAGANSTILTDAVARVVCELSGDDLDALARASARSFIVSCDNVHAVHPNHPELTDEVNSCHMNAGVVVKEAARQSYATDALSRALFVRICRDAQVPTQTYANRSDLRGGSTIGNISARKLGMHAVDVGLAQLAMHSAYETAGARDVAHLARAVKAFCESDFAPTRQGGYAL